MADKTKIEWSSTINPDGSVTPGATWNPIRPREGGWSCEKVSPACAYCYAESLNRRLGNGKAYLPGIAPDPELHRETLFKPIHWKRPRTIFVNSMTDTFWERVTDEMIDFLFAIAADCQRHTFLFLTKRAERMEHWFNRSNAEDRVRKLSITGSTLWPGWPLPNVWIGATVENQRMAEKRVPYLINTPAVVHFVSCEPLLGPIQLSNIKVSNYFSKGETHLNALRGSVWVDHEATLAQGKIDWVIGGGESNGPETRRLVWQDECGKWVPTPKGLEWARLLRDEAFVADVAFFWKQWGGPTPKSGGRMMSHRTWSERPYVQRSTIPPHRYIIRKIEPGAGFE